MTDQQVSSDMSLSSSLDDKDKSPQSSSLKITKLPELNPQSLKQIEKEAMLLAKDFFKLNTQLQASLNNISAATVCSLQTYEDTIYKNCEVVDESLKEEKIFLIKAKELSRTMEPIYKLQEKISSIKTVITTLESQI